MSGIFIDYYSIEYVTIDYLITIRSLKSIFDPCVQIHLTNVFNLESTIFKQIKMVCQLDSNSQSLKHADP